LLWSDEFNTLDLNNWRQETGGHGWGNNELQFYTDRNSRSLNGNLIIEAKRESFQNRVYTSSRLRSTRKFKYGVFEMRAKLPKGRGEFRTLNKKIFIKHFFNPGTWSAFWLLAAKRPLNWPNDGEIDIMVKAIMLMKLINRYFIFRNMLGMILM
jgi:beta-glucanase (GH16 family)